LDAGTLDINDPNIVGEPEWSFTFSDTPDADVISFSSATGGGTVYGNWTAAGTVPIPASMWLLGSGLLGLSGLAKKKQTT
jgi:hypothetical protein